MTVRGAQGRSRTGEKAIAAQQSTSSRPPHLDKSRFVLSRHPSSSGVLPLHFI